MSSTTAVDTSTGRFDAHSADGTPLAVWVDGTGPPLVMVHGSPTDHGTFKQLVETLRSDVTTFAMDRRGSGASGDATAYSIEREFEDVAAVVDVVSERTGGPVSLWGHSYGCNPAMGGAARTRNVDSLILYEPSFGLAYPAGAIEAIERAVVAGDFEAALRAALVDTGAMTDEEFSDYQKSSQWPKILASTQCLPRECRVENDWVYTPGQFDSVSAPTLLLTGAETDPELAELTRLAAAAIPGAQVRVLPGHGHFAFRTDPAMVATIIREFISLP